MKIKQIITWEDSLFALTNAASMNKAVWRIETQFGSKTKFTDSPFCTNLLVWNGLLCGVTSRNDITLWIANAEIKFILEGHTDTISCLVANQHYLFSGSHDKTIRRWNIN